MATRVSTQMSFDRTLFLPEMTVQAMRDSRYRHPANAVAELIDNSIDAKATHVEVLIREQQIQVNRNKSWRVGKLAVFDNGHGMSPEVLVQALRFGGRQGSSTVTQIGKYGMGLPTSSVSQCKRVDVWTWTSRIEHSVHSSIDIDQIEQGNQLEVPEPDRLPVPEEWLKLVSPETLDKKQGTLVVWSKPDRITARASTIFRQIEEEMGRIYRRYIHEQELSVRMVSVRSEGQKPRIDQMVRPNDPLYLMSNSTTPEPWSSEPMFKPFSKKVFRIPVGGREEVVEVICSIAKAEALGDFKGEHPGNRDYGQHARKNMGISVIRENREILLENFFITEGGGGSVPENRWWGCEVNFGSGCDDLFGVDHNKQMVSHFSRAVQDLAAGDGRSAQKTLEDLAAGENDIYAIAFYIRNTARSMMKEIKRMFKQRPSKHVGGDTNGVPESTEQTAVNLVTGVIRESMEEEGSTPTRTDKVRAELDPRERASQLATQFIEEGIDEPEARYRAQNIVSNDDWFSIVPAQLTGSQMFSFISRGGVLNMRLNIDHPIYRFLEVIEEDVAESGNEVARKAAIGILAMLLSWGRMEDDIERPEIRIQVQDRAMHWGKMVSGVLRDLNADSEANI